MFIFSAAEIWRLPLRADWSNKGIPHPYSQPWCGKARTFGKRVGVETSATLPELHSDDVLILAVKPQDMEAACKISAPTAHWCFLSQPDCRSVRSAVTSGKPPHCPGYAEYTRKNRAGRIRYVCRSGSIGNRPQDCRSNHEISRFDRLVGR